MKPPATIFLVDNGSLRPDAIRQLRRLAKALGRKLGRAVEPVSVLHSDRVPPEKIGGRPAEVLEPALRRRAELGQRRFVILPLYVGRSAALTAHIPELAGKLRRVYPNLQVRVAAPLGARRARDLRKILGDLSRAKMGASVRTKPTKVVLVDHGSPSRSVAWTRNRARDQLLRELGRGVDVRASSMERRPGPKYAFNEPLLENILATPPFNRGRVVVAQLFLLPGRHAGPDGDIAQICQRAEARNPGLRTVRTALVGTHPGVIDLLAKRFHELG